MKPNNIPCLGRRLYRKKVVLILFYFILFYLKDQSDREKKAMKNTQEKRKAAKVTQSFRVRWGVKSLA